MFRELTLWKIYSTFTTVLIAVLVFSGFQIQPRARFSQIDVERINVVEKNGKLRMTISNKERAPDAIIGGKRFQRQGGNSAGLIFYNDQDDECGGLAFSSSLRDGKPYSESEFLFDQRNQDQTVGITYHDLDGKRSAGLRVWNRPDAPLAPQIDVLRSIQSMKAGPDKDAAMRKFRQGDFGALRLFAGQAEDKSARIVLSDLQGRPRLALSVDAAGAPRLEFLDENGKVFSSFPAAGSGPPRD